MKGMGASVFDTIANIAGRGAATSDSLTQAIQAAPKIQAQAEEAVNVAESWAIASVILQAVAAFSALGMFVIHQKTYNKRYRGGNVTVSSNPRRRRKKR